MDGARTRVGKFFSLTRLAIYSCYLEGKDKEVEKLDYNGPDPLSRPPHSARPPILHHSPSSRGTRQSYFSAAINGAERKTVSWRAVGKEGASEGPRKEATGRAREAEGRGGPLLGIPRVAQPLACPLQHFLSLCLLLRTFMTTDNDSVLATEPEFSSKERHALRARPAPSDPAFRSSPAIRH